MGETIQHSKRKHALLSASGADRWLNCTPSARLEEKFQESSSVYADEGTLAHEFANAVLLWFNGEMSNKEAQKELRQLRKHKLYGGIEMENEVEKYVLFVKELFNVSKVENPGTKLLIEQRLDFSHIVENGFGTGDTCIVNDGILDVIDLKYGKGVRVDAEDNSQLKLYGVGALRLYDLIYDIHTVRMTIVQPRLDHVSTAEISVTDLIHWAENIVRPTAQLAYQGQGEKIVGDWCRWCRAKALCTAFADHNMQLAKHDFKDPDLLDDEDILAIFKQQPMLLDWVNAVAKHLLDEALKGKQWTGYKLVEGKSNRKWTNEDKVKEALKKAGFEENKYLVSKLDNLTNIEKLVGKANYQTVLAPVIIKPPGAPTLVPEADPRPAMNGLEQAAIDFAPEPED